jgi:hypothetical protein
MMCAQPLIAGAGYAHRDLPSQNWRGRSPYMPCPSSIGLGLSINYG